MNSEDEKVAEATILRLTKALADVEEQLLVLAKNTKQLEDQVANHPERAAELSPLIALNKDTRRMVQQRIEIILREFQAALATFRDDN